MNDRIRKALSVLLAITFCVCTALFIRQQLHEKQADAAYESAAQMAVSSQKTAPESEPPVQTEATQETQPEAPQMEWTPEPIHDDETATALQQIDLDALREENPEVIGWIQIPDTKINYPIMQTGDNTYYLKHDWNGKRNVLGSIFMEKENNRDMTDFNTIIYGHNVQSGRMFAALHDYDEQAFWQAHPYVYVVTDLGVLRYEIFSTYNAPVESSAYRLSFRQEKTRVSFLEEAIANSLIDTGIVPATTDRILTLSTCTGTGYSARRVVLARLKMVQTPIE